MEGWDKMRRPVNRVCKGVAVRLGIRKPGLLKLTPDIRACEYEDVQVMWEMLRKNEIKNARLSGKRKKRPCWNCFGWARCAPYFRRSF
ncbi:hypothetical protein K2173_028445 [Erythroxylum novogranatense]|uniref:Uncharacterized protein n=1 Tax=Erythroxylum novogranatense TaxID=1862640 RepID=A0AAV8U5X8_9ROSI|nr:hypothetical protein K2173_028445 [Erythroxylum novogranatense]